MIADLEKEWNVTLLERNKKGVCLTSSGEQILPFARKTLNDFEKMQEKVNEWNSKWYSKNRNVFQCGN